MLPLNANINVNGPNRPQVKPTKSFTVFGNTFVGVQGQAKSQFKASNGKTAAQHTREGVLAHERAHDREARAAGLQTSGPILETKNGMTLAGHVNLEVPQLDTKRAATDSAYLASFKRKSQGLVNSATAPESAGIGGYGHMSHADQNVAAIGRSNLAKANSISAQSQQVKAASAKAKTQGVAANFGYHPDLLNAFNNGNIG